MILDDLVDATNKRIKEHENRIPIKELQTTAQNLKTVSGFKTTLENPGLHVIAEIKQASPSKGVIVEDFPYLQIAHEYRNAKVDAISVLTEPHYFHGKLTYLREVSEHVPTPVLRKDFTINEYMIYEAKANGASVILLIVAILSDQQLEQYRNLAESLGMDAIVEAHDESEVHRAIKSGAKIIGINNRNLKNFTVNFKNSIHLKKLIPNNILTISESGIKTQKDVDVLRDAGFNAILVGETLMRSTNKEQLIRQFKKVE